MRFRSLLFEFGVLLLILGVLAIGLIIGQSLTRYKCMTNHARVGFSLVELSIVLVILGLLTGGILAGQSLIRASELRAATTEAEMFTSSVSAFRDRYMAVPGDMTNATAFWGKDNTNCSGNSGISATHGTCNGNGNGIIDAANLGDAANAGSGHTVEMFQFWNHLALAGLISGSFTGISATGPDVYGYGVLAGRNEPRAKIGRGVWTVLYKSPNYAPTPGWMFNINYGNYLILSADLGDGNFPGGSDADLLRPEEAWNIDKKLDDGKPGYGKIIASDWDNLCSAADSGVSASTNLAASYRLQDTALRCALFFRDSF